MRGAGKPQARDARILGAATDPRLEVPCGLACDDVQDLVRRRLRWNSQTLHGEPLLGRPLVGARSEPDFKMPVCSQQLRSADFGKPARHVTRGRLNKRRQLTRVLRSMPSGRREAPCPGQKLRRPAQRNFERAAESKQLAPESEQEVPGGQRLYQLRGDVPGVSEAGSRHPRLGAVEEQYGSAFAGERIGDGRADHARTHHCHGVGVPSVERIRSTSYEYTTLSSLEVDSAATQLVQAALIRDGVHGLVLMVTAGEGNSLARRAWTGTPRKAVTRMTKADTAFGRFEILRTRLLVVASPAK